MVKAALDFAKAILWPGTTVFLVYKFKDQLTVLSKDLFAGLKVKSLEAGALKIQLESAREGAEQKVIAAEAIDVKALPPGTPQEKQLESGTGRAAHTATLAPASTVEVSDNAIVEISKETIKSSPNAAINVASTGLETALSQAARRLDIHWTKDTASQITTSQLLRRGAITRETAEAIASLRHFRNVIMSDQSSLTPEVAEDFIQMTARVSLSISRDVEAFVAKKL